MGVSAVPCAFAEKGSRGAGGRAVQPHEFRGQFLEGQITARGRTRGGCDKVVETIAHNPKQVREQFGRSVGIGSTFYFFLRGTGRVVSVSDDSIGLSLENTGDTVDISVPLGPCSATPCAMAPVF